MNKEAKKILIKIGKSEGAKKIAYHRLIKNNYKATSIRFIYPMGTKDICIIISDEGKSLDINGSFQLKNYDLILKAVDLEIAELNQTKMVDKNNSKDTIENLL